MKSGDLLDENTLWDISKAVSIFPLTRVFKRWDTLNNIAGDICLDKMSDGKLDDYLDSKCHWWVCRDYYNYY